MEVTMPYDSRARCFSSSLFLNIWMLLAAVIVTTPVRAADVTPKMQPKIDTYKKQAAMWAMDPVIVKAVKESNAKGPIPMLGNAKWRELKESDPIVKGLVDNPAGQRLTKWMNADAKGINKIVLSGDKSHRVAFTSMPAIYIGKGKPTFDESFSGKVGGKGGKKTPPRAKKKKEEKYEGESEKREGRGRVK